MAMYPAMTYQEASLHDVVASAAIFVRLREMVLEMKATPLGFIELVVPPVPPLVVLGHVWFLHWTFWVAPDVTVFGALHELGYVDSAGLFTDWIRQLWS